MYVVQYIYKPESIFKPELDSRSGQIEHTQIVSVSGWCGYVGHGARVVSGHARDRGRKC